MEDLILDKEQYIANKAIQLRVLFQLAIETLDDLNNVDARYGNKKLGAMLKSIYPALDKETKKYDECYHEAPEGITQFYNSTQMNLHYIMSMDLLDQHKICMYLMSYEKNPKEIEGIIDKILK